MSPPATAVPAIVFGFQPINWVVETVSIYSPDLGTLREMRGSFVVYQGARTSGPFVKWPPLTQQLDAFASLSEPCGFVARDAAYSSATAVILTVQMRFYDRRLLSAPTYPKMVTIKTTGKSFEQKLEEKYAAPGNGASLMKDILDP